jgi:hypothetical protein
VSGLRDSIDSSPFIISVNTRSLVAQMIGFELLPNLPHGDERKLNFPFWCHSN